jgi:hypothetical protein
MKHDLVASRQLRRETQFSRVFESKTQLEQELESPHIDNSSKSSIYLLPSMNSPVPVPVGCSLEIGTLLLLAIS